jgi:hypothetical protein
MPDSTLRHSSARARSLEHWLGVPHQWHTPRGLISKVAQPRSGRRGKPDAHRSQLRLRRVGQQSRRAPAPSTVRVYSMGSVLRSLSPTRDSNHDPRLFCPFRALNFGGLFTQGGASRLRRSALPWADMLRPLRGKEASAVSDVFSLGLPVVRNWHVLEPCQPYRFEPGSESGCGSQSGHAAGAGGSRDATCL